jgi:predicted GNAT family acetyltransferase
MIARGDRPMLHVRTDNPAARVYEHVGFTTDRILDLLIVRRL